MEQTLGGWVYIGITLYVGFEIGDGHVWSDIDRKDILLKGALRGADGNRDLPTNVINDAKVNERMSKDVHVESSGLSQRAVGVRDSNCLESEWMCGVSPTDCCDKE